MVDANEEFVSMPYTFYKGEEGPVDEDVDVLQRRQLDSDYLQDVVAKQIAKKLKEQGIFVWRNGYALIGGTDRIDKSSAVNIEVDGSFQSFTLQAYDPRAPKS
ncbi:hypothetical protein TX23_04255 [Pseudomonas paralactis]|uniref:Uncharacterized protein n=1 Tax=Pseudomonas paralactis TaxID=1615673 RepID=A0A0R3ANK7_9PSED|nr:hypothetical protein [Pseudomonas paralactis]KRP73644.1 hypothetical protein TX23_04255 [Pseudomonas paralactis]